MSFRQMASRIANTPESSESGDGSAANLVEVKTEYAQEYEGDFVFGYFDSEPTVEDGAKAYFEEYLHQELPPNWQSWPDYAGSHGGFSVPPSETEGGWKVLLGEPGR